MSSKRLRNPDDGELYDVPDQDVDAALAAGYTAGEKLINPDDGDEYEVPHAEVEAARAAGYKPREAAEVAPAEPEQLKAGLPIPDDVKAAGGELAQGVQEEAPGWGDAVLTGVQGATRYLGGDLIREGANRLETKIQGAFGHTPETAPVDLFQSRDEVLANKEAHPTAATVGEAAGLVGSAFVPVSGIAKALPALGINAAGAAVGAKVAAKLAPEGANLFRVALAKTGGIVAQGGVETVLQGAAQEVNDAFLRGDYTQLAQKLPARVIGDFTEGAAWSAGTAGVLGIAKKGLQATGLIGRGAKKVGDFVGDQANNIAKRGEQRAAGDVADALDEQAEQAVQHQHAIEADNAALDAHALSARTADEVIAAADARAAQLARRADDRALTLVEKAAGARQHADAVVEGTQKIRSLSDELLAIDDHFDEFAGKGAKQAANRADPLLREWGAPVADPEFTGTVDEIGQQARAMLADHGAAAYAATGGTAALKRIATTADAFSASIKKSMRGGQIADAYNLADDFKGLLGRLHNAKDSAVRQFAEQSYPRMLNLLEDTDKFGPLAERQKPFNAALSTEIKAQSGFGVNGLIEDSGRSSKVNPFRNAEITNDKAVRSLLNEAGSGVAAQEDAYRNWLAAKETGFMARAQALGSPKLIALAKRARELTRGIASELDNVTRLRRGKDEFEAAKAAAELTPGVAGFNPAMAYLKTADLTAVARIEAQRAALEAGRVSRAASAQSVAEKLRKAQEQVNQAAERGKLWRAVGDAGRATAATGAAVDRGARAAVKAVDATADALQKRHVIKLIKELDDREDPDSAQTRKRQAAIANMARAVGPDMAAAFEQQQKQRDAFILEKAGPPPAPTPFDGKPERVMSDTEAKRIQSYIDAADDPVQAIKRVGDGEASAEDMETLEELHMDVLSEFREKAVDSITASKRELPYARQLAISQALGVPLTPDEQPDAVAFWQDVAQAGAQVAQAKKAAKAFKVSTQSVASKASALG